jgi:hypothetical protein
VPADAWQYLQLAAISYRAYLRGNPELLPRAVQYGRHALDHGAQISALVDLLERVRATEAK